MPHPQLIQNFGHNLQFRPQHHYTPRNEAEILDILQQHQQGQIRVIGARHAWSEGIKSDDVSIDLRNFQQFQLHQRTADNYQNAYVSVGAGMPIKTILAKLNEQGFTLPTIGLIAAQTIGGAIATGTHGSGKSSLSHYVQAVRIASFDPTGEIAQIQTLVGGPALLAARCSLGCLGIITEITLPCIPQYAIQEKATPCTTIEQALALETQSPLQQFFLMPHHWAYVVQERSIPNNQTTSGYPQLYRLYWFLNLDLGLHLLIKCFAASLRSRRLVRWLFRSLMPRLLFPKWVVTDRSDRQLIMKHELFRHFELEAFVPRTQVIAASHFITDILKLADDHQHALTAQTVQQLNRIGLQEPAETLRGQFTHHYPICFRRVQPDETLLSMTAGTSEDWYAMSFITYTQPRNDFQLVAAFLARSLFALFQARIHWGKWFPLEQKAVVQAYPRLDEFLQVRDCFDPNRVFQNEFTQSKLG
ncbi:FAD-binding protein [filamentous cyanobacterium LEGE 11480]|uniref:FAD-binding protein n=1 Tax=Romeriopsis navalis LEGE 11480 TaxID=2777977 RepID=A0A928VLJ6_9CYAN|nr:D-arabinono-1,4-lactone oxidase [Romeriopsis navalis]MBE9028229.1 FAD-binding protein [Romeriopsis navalis LEGE 11480]